MSPPATGVGHTIRVQGRVEAGSWKGVVAVEGQ